MLADLGYVVGPLALGVVTDVVGADSALSARSKACRRGRPVIDQAPPRGAFQLLVG
jgi:hypothetical protein